MSEEEPRSRRRRGTKRSPPPPSDTAALATRTSKKPRASGEPAVSGKGTTAEHRQTFRWIDEGTESPNGTVSYTTLEVTSPNGSSYRVCIGDAVKLLSDDVSLSARTAVSSDEAFIARVERMWEAAPSRKKRLQSSTRLNVRWYFKKEDVKALEGKFAGPISREQLLKTMSSKDLVLSDQTDDNDICSIVGKCRVILRRPSSEPTPSLAENTFVSRYKIRFRTNPNTAVVVAHDGPSDDWPGSSKQNAQGARQSLRARRKASDETTVTASKDGASTRGATSQDGSSASSSSSDESSDDDSTSSSQDRAPETEGSTIKRNINVGPEYQVNVPPFASKQAAKSRSPVLVWKPSPTLSDEEYDNYLARSADILTAFLQENGFFMQEWYAPLPSSKFKSRLKSDPNSRPMTLSNVSTGSSMVSNKNGKLTRECKVDDILAVLVKKNHDVQQALDVIAASPRDFLTLWTKSEKEIFDRGFRRHTGSLRAIRKMLEPSKSYKDIVDYHYRFKIPDQYRRYQEKAQEQAVRMMECIEKRRYHDSIALSRDDSRKMGTNGKASDWSKTGASAVIGAVEQRRIAAKEVLLEMQAALDSDKLALIVKAIKALHDPASVDDLKAVLLDMLKGHPDLLERSMEFLPRRLRG